MIKFGPSGNSLSFYDEGYKHTYEAAKWLKDKGLDCFEYSFGRGVRMNDDTAAEIKEAFEKEGVEISVHAPYYTNFANPSDEMIEKSIGYVRQSVEAAHKLGAYRVVFHPAACGSAERADAVKRTKETLYRLAENLSDIPYDYIVCPETMGKLNQIGTVEEVLDFCRIDSHFYPCFDFGHINCYTQGALKTADDFKRITDLTAKILGDERAKNFHVHFSKIEYGPKGELRHLTFEDSLYGPDFEPLAEVLYKENLSPHILCESDGTMAEDALHMKKIYDSLRG